MTDDERAAVCRVADLFYEAGRADGYGAARADVLCPAAPRAKSLPWE
jgi:hypothetical protein